MIRRTSLVLAAIATLATTDAALARQGWTSLFFETGYGAVIKKRDFVKDEASGIPVGLGLRAVQPLGFLALQTEVRGTYTYGLQSSADDRIGSLFGKAMAGPRFGSGSITLGVGWDNLLQEVVFPVVSWTILDTDDDGDDRYREMFLGWNSKGIAAGGTREFVWDGGGSFSLGVLFFGGGKSADPDEGAGVLFTLSMGKGRTSGPLAR